MMIESIQERDKVVKSSINTYFLTLQSTFIQIYFESNFIALDQRYFSEQICSHTFYASQILFQLNQTSLYLVLSIKFLWILHLLYYKLPNILARKIDFIGALTSFWHHCCGFLLRKTLF